MWQTYTSDHATTNEQITSRQAILSIVLPSSATQPALMYTDHYLTISSILFVPPAGSFPSDPRGRAVKRKRLSPRPGIHVGVAAGAARVAVPGCPYAAVFAPPARVTSPRRRHSRRDTAAVSERTNRSRARRRTSMRKHLLRSFPSQPLSDRS